jgi:hypothetical protein
MVAPGWDILRKSGLIITIYTQKTGFNRDLLQGIPVEKGRFHSFSEIQFG